MIFHSSLIYYLYHIHLIRSNLNGNFAPVCLSSLPLCCLSLFSSLASFIDEDFSVEHNKRGIVGMANKGRHTNGSQFYITLQPAPWMDTKYVAFG